MCNSDIKEKMRICGVYQWQVADYLGISEATMCRKMRGELDPDFRNQIDEAISTLSTPPRFSKTRNSGAITINK